MPSPPPNNHLSPFRFQGRWNEKYVWNNIRSIRSQVIYFWTDMNVKYSLLLLYTLRNPLPFIRWWKKISSPFSRCSNRAVDGKHIQFFLLALQNTFRCSFNLESVFNGKISTLRLATVCCGIFRLARGER